MTRIVALLLLLVSACSGRSQISSNTNVGGVGGFDGTAGSAGSNPSGLGGSEVLTQCSTPDDCLQLPSACVYATCISGACGFVDVAKGAFVEPDPPGDCHHSECDGAGNAVPVIDVSDVPVSAKPCFTSVCDPVIGNVRATPVAAGADCSDAAGGTRCDSQGNCVGCLDTADCASGKVCSALNTCVAPAMASCDDGQKIKTRPTSTAAAPACLAR
jgi:hypothetical protein